MASSQRQPTQKRRGTGPCGRCKLKYLPSTREATEGAATLAQRTSNCQRTSARFEPEIRTDGPRRPISDDRLEGGQSGLRACRAEALRGEERAERAVLSLQAEVVEDHRLDELVDRVCRGIRGRIHRAVRGVPADLLTGRAIARLRPA